MKGGERKFGYAITRSKNREKQVAYIGHLAIYDDERIEKQIISVRLTPGSEGDMRKRTSR